MPIDLNQTLVMAVMQEEPFPTVAIDLAYVLAGPIRVWIRWLAYWKAPSFFTVGVGIGVGVK